jgi:hypothetical protein
MRPAGILTWSCRRSEDRGQVGQRRMGWRVRHFLIGGVAFVIVVGLIGWHFWGGRGEVLKPDGGPVVTVMDFGRSFPLHPLPPGWRHRKFWIRSPMTMTFTVKDGCRACGLKPVTARRCCFATSISISPPIRCSRGGTSNCRSAARSTSAREKETITRRGSFFDS